jgi:hypothetical protein
MQNYILHLKKKKHWYGIDFPDLYGRKFMIFEKRNKKENGIGNAIEVKDSKTGNNTGNVKALLKFDSRQRMVKLLFLPACEIKYDIYQKPNRVKQR